MPGPDYPGTYGFWSYARQDGQISDGKLNLLRQLIQGKLQGLKGRSKVDIWQDASNLEYGDVWREKIKENIDRSLFFIPVITPSFLQSEFCREETHEFIKRESILNRKDLIFPIYYIETEHLSIDDPNDCLDPAMWRLLQDRQGFNFVSMVDEKLTEPSVEKAIRDFARKINAKLPRNVISLPLTPEVHAEVANPYALGTRSGSEERSITRVDRGANKAAQDGNALALVPAASDTGLRPNHPGLRQDAAPPKPELGVDAYELNVEVVTAKPAAFNVAARFEVFAEKINPLNVFTVSLIMGLMLIALSSALGVSDIYNNDGKQVGFKYAPNWSIMYTLLFPSYNALFCSMVNHVRKAFDNLIEEGVVTSIDGSNVSISKMLNSWTKHLSSVSLSFWALVLFVGLISIIQYKLDIYNIVMSDDSKDRVGRAIDWGTYTVEHPETIGAVAQMMFSGIAYAYMAMALWVYLAILLYVPTFAWYLRRLASGEGSFGIVLQGLVFQKTAENMMRRTFTCTFLGLLASYLMRLQSAYRNSSETNIWSYVASGDEDWIATALHQSFTRAAGHDFALWSSWTSLSVALVAIVSFVLSVAFMREAFENARSYLMSHFRREDWRRRVGFQMDTAELDRLDATSFRKEIMPYYPIYPIIMMLISISIICPNHVVFLAFGIATFCLFMIFTRKNFSRKLLVVQHT